MKDAQHAAQQTAEGKAAASATEKAAPVYELLAKDHPTEQEFDLLLRHVAPGVLAKRYLSTGLPFVFKDQPHKYLAFREAVGRIFLTITDFGGYEGECGIRPGRRRSGDFAANSHGSGVG